MALSSDALADRRRMRRRLILWRSLAAVAAAVAVLAWAGVSGLGKLGGKGDHVAWIAITGVIVSDDERRDAGRRHRARAVVQELAPRRGRPRRALAPPCAQPICPPSASACPRVRVSRAQGAPR